MTVHFHGFMSEQELKELRDKEDKLFAENMNLIMKNSEIIINTPEFFYCEFGSAWLSLAYIGGDGMIPLGVLLMLWKQEKLMDCCKHCGADVYIIGAGGSPLSGSHTWHGLCIDCRQYQIGSKESFREIASPLRELMIKYRIKDSKGLDVSKIIEHERQQVNQPPIASVDLNTLIKTLSKNE